MKLFYILIFFLCVHTIRADFSDIINTIRGYLHLNAKKNTLDVNYIKKIPYEVSPPDEKFIQEASYLTGITLSELDSCQQRVVLHLKTNCNKLNDESLAKMAVALLNCQSYVEGRKIYPCSEEMTIKQCTSDMDADTWTSYHLMSNRARAVCYQIRQEQLNLITTSIDGIEGVVDLAYVIVWHLSFILFAMLICSFLYASFFTRLIVSIVPPINLGIALNTNKIPHLGPVSLTIFIILAVLINNIVSWILYLKRRKRNEIIIKNKEELSQKETEKYKLEYDSSSFEDINKSFNDTTSNNYNRDDCFEQPTPPPSIVRSFKSRSITPIIRNSLSTYSSRAGTPFSKCGSVVSVERNHCNAITKAGTPCRLYAVKGYEYCKRHQRRESTIG